MNQFDPSPSPSFMNGLFKWGMIGFAFFMFIVWLLWVMVSQAQAAHGYLDRLEIDFTDPVSIREGFSVTGWIWIDQEREFGTLAVENTDKACKDMFGSTSVLVGTVEKVRGRKLLARTPVCTLPSRPDDFDPLSVCRLLSPRSRFTTAVGSLGSTKIICLHERRSTT